MFSEKPIIEIALIAGYESQQAFTSIFKFMYKQTPLKYRQNEVFYPLQLEFTLNKNPSAPGAVMQEIFYAALADIPDWMNFVSLVIDGFPCLDEISHLEQVKQYIQQRQVLIMRDGSAIFSYGFLFCGLNNFTSAMFTVLSNGKVSAVLSFLHTFGLLAGGILLSLHIWGITGVWLSVPIAEGIMFFVSAACLAHYRKRYFY